VSAALALALVMTAAPVERTISVSGDAEVKVAPDQVQVMLAVETAEKTVAKAKAANDERLARTLAVLKKQGIAEKDLQTDQVSITPVNDSGSYGFSKTKEPDGYQVRRSVSVLLRDVTKFEVLLTAVLEAGTNHVEGISFQTSELRRFRDQARALALKAAKEKAEAMAKEYGLKVGKPRTIAETSSGWAGPFLRGGMAQNLTQSVGGSPESSDTFAAGQISVRATVSVTFDLD
jgi:uncharacterized protein YggE